MKEEYQETFTRKEALEMSIKVAKFSLDEVLKNMNQFKHYGLPSIDPKHLTRMPKNPHAWNYSKVPVDNVFKNYKKLLGQQLKEFK